MTRRTHTSLRENQAGMVSILIVMIMSIVISIVTLGFIRIMFRESRAALDNQLNTQAFYAAESGISDARLALHLGFTPAGVGIDNNCQPANFAAFKPVTQLADTPVDYPCQLIEKVVPSIVFSGSESAGKTYPIQTQEGQTKTIRIEWEATKDIPSVTSPWPAANDKSLPNQLATYAALRVTLINAAGGLDRNSLTRNERNLVLKPAPASAPGVVNSSEYSLTGGAADGILENASCEPISVTRKYQCAFDLTYNGVGGPFDTSGDPNGVDSRLYLRIRPIYNPAEISIRAINQDATGANIDQLLLNAQYRIDVTGRASDIYRRLSVRLSQDAKLNLIYPDYEIDSGNICKQLELSNVLEKTACGDVSPTATPPLSGCNGTNGVADGSGNCSGNPNGNGNCNGTGNTNCNSGDPNVGFDFGDSGGCDGRCTYVKYIRGKEDSNCNCDVPLRNTSDPGGISCTWSWGDNSPDSPTACNTGDWITHNYPHNANWRTCRDVYTVILTENYPGLPPKTYKQNVGVPWWVGVDDISGNEVTCP